MVSGNASIVSLSPLPPSSSISFPIHLPFPFPFPFPFPNSTGHSALASFVSCTSLFASPFCPLPYTQPAQSNRTPDVQPPFHGCDGLLPFFTEGNYAQEQFGRCLSSSRKRSLGRSSRAITFRTARFMSEIILRAD
jgi:hypothetical protein